MTYPILVFEFLLLMEIFHRIRLLTAAHIILLFVFLSQSVFYHAHFLGYVDWLGFSSELTMADEGVELYALIFMVVYASTSFISIKRNNFVMHHAREILRRSEAFQKYAFVIVSGLVLVDFLALDHSALWFNSRYLLLNSPLGLLYPNTVTLFIHSLLSLLFLVSVFFLFFNLFTNNKQWALLWSVPAIWGIVFSLACSSRTSVLLAFVPVVLSYILLGRSKKFYVPLFLFVAVWFLASALAGRSTGGFGISAVPMFLVNAFSGKNDLTDMLFNLFQGVFITNDGLTFEATFSNQYKVLSFSLLPSFVDGFTEIRRISEIRLHRYVPMSAISEVLHFGYVYTLIFFGVLACIIRLSIKSIRKSFVVYLISTPYIFSIFVMAGAYPTRNVFRQLCLILLMLLMSDVLHRGRMKFRKRASSSLMIAEKRGV